MRKISMAYIFCIAFFTTRSQILLPDRHAVYSDINAYSRFNKDALSVLANQAALGSFKILSVAFYGERKFMLKDLGSYSMAFTLPSSSGSFGLAAHYFGSVGLNESSLGLAYGKSLGKIEVGAQFNYCQLKIEGYGNASTVSVETGIILHLTEQLQAGVHIFNPTGATMGKAEQEKLPLIYSFGLGYDVSDRVYIGTEVQKVEDQPVSVNAGLQYAFERKLFARAGVASATSSFYLGVGFLWSGFRIDVNASVHPTLGTTPSMLIAYNSPAKK
ncbi:MAG: hypothetical protein ACXVLT_03090 [Flavisolibacter sp.]